MRNIGDTMGFVNTGNNCFINCLIISMFGYTHSPFNNVKTVTKNSHIIYEYIQTRMKKLLDGEMVDLSNIRNILPANMKFGQQDILETYEVLIEIIGYNPMIYCTQRHLETENNKIKLNKPILTKTGYVQLDNSGEDNLKPIDLFFNPILEDLGQNNIIKDDNVEYRYTKNIPTEIESECLVFSINRTSGFDKKLNNIILLPNFINIGNNVFFKFSTVVHLGSSSNSGHYILVMYDGVNHCIYNDNSQSVIKNNVIDYEKSKDVIERNSVMVFYFKTV